MKRYDCCIIRDEIELLKIRFEELNDHVDYFIIVEANKTFSGEDKEFVVEKHMREFSRYYDKIRYVKVTDMPETTINHRRWRESFQRNCILRGFDKVDEDDTIFISDVDELWNWRAILGETRQFPLVFEQMPMSRKLNLRHADLNARWYGTVVVYGHIIQQTTPQHLRLHKNGYERVGNGGWHFSSVGTDKDIRRKFNTICHGFDKKMVDIFLSKLEFLEGLVEMDLDWLPPCIKRNESYLREKGYLYAWDN